MFKLEHNLNKTEAEMEHGKLVLISTRGRITREMVEGIIALDEISSGKFDTPDEELPKSREHNLCNTCGGWIDEGGHCNCRQDHFPSDN